MCIAPVYVYETKLRKQADRIDHTCGRSVALYVLHQLGLDCL